MVGSKDCRDTVNNRKSKRLRGGFPVIEGGQYGLTANHPAIHLQGKPDDLHC